MLIVLAHTSINYYSCSKKREIDAVLSALEEDNEISLVGFGRFYKTHIEARTGRNPKTGEPIKIVAYVQPRFTAGIKLKEACNKKKKLKKLKSDLNTIIRVKISLAWVLS